MVWRSGREFLQTPGPTNVPDRVLNAMHRPAMDISCPAFLDLAAGCFRDIKPVFGTEQGQVFIYTGNGHGAWEAVLVNTLSPGDRILMPETGRFSRSWGEMAESLGYAVDYLPTDWRTGIKPDAVEAALRADTGHAIKAVLAVQVETATGVQSDMPAIRRAIDAAGHPALFFVDAIASLMTTPLPLDAWGIDAICAASQKGLMMPPGLGFVAAGPRALAAAEQARSPRNYWSWTGRTAKEQYRRFCGTAPTHLIYALREVLDIFAEVGLESIYTRHATLAAAVRACVGKWSEAGALEFQALNPQERSNAITAVRVPDGVDAEDVRTCARDRFMVALGGGLGAVEGKVFRIGHMGDLNAPMILGALGGVEAALSTLRIPYGPGGLDAAVAVIAAADG